MRKLLLLIALVVLAFGSYYGTRHKAGSGAQPPGPASTNAQAPLITATDLDGNKMDTASYGGKVVLVNFWAAWCTPCAEEVPQLMALQTKYGDQGLRVIGFSMDDSDSALRDFYRKYKMNYPVAAGNQRIAEAYGGILGLPTSILISRDGRIRVKYPGMADFRKLEQDIVDLLHAHP